VDRRDRGRPFDDRLDEEFPADDDEEIYEEVAEEEELEVHLPPVAPPRRRSTRRKYAIPVEPGTPRRCCG